MGCSRRVAKGGRSLIFIGMQIQLFSSDNLKPQIILQTIYSIPEEFSRVMTLAH
jgi:hypothetical protein